MNRSLPVVLDDGSRRYVWGLGLAYAVDSAGVVGVPHADGLGSVRALTDGSGSVAQTYRTDEFGIPEAADTLGVKAQPFQYTGEPRDAESGFVYLRARMYDPQSGRFLQRDPFAGKPEDPRSLTFSAYAHAHPTHPRTPGLLSSTQIV